MNLKENLSKKIAISIILLLFILLNVFDFMNFLSGDLDFFKKILSWAIIGYIFYKASISRIFIGEKLRGYDLSFIIAFSLFTIPKSILLYIRNISVNNAIPDSYVIFDSFLKLFIDFENIIVDKLSATEFLQITFLIGILLTLILCVGLLLNNSVREKSFIGSFNIKEGWKKYLIEQALLISFAIFFGLVIFNFFMEWFALAVDAIILVVGVVYYLLKYVKNHTETKLSNYLSNVSNSGNQFYLNLLETFADKKKLFIGISFILALHMLVDGGVYLIPYTIGTENTLYFEALNAEGRNHLPIFDFANIAEIEFSQFGNDLAKVGGDWFFTISIIIIDVLNLILFYSLLAFPFYFLYKSISGKKVNIQKSFAILFLLSFILYVAIIAMPSISNPINIDMPKNQVRGVDIYTDSIFSQSETIESGILLWEFTGLVIVGLVSLSLMLFRYDKYKFYFNKLLLLIVLMFFIIYMGMFFWSTVSTEYFALKGEITSKLENGEYTRLSLLKDSYTIEVFEGRDEANNIVGKAILFSDKNIHFSNFSSYNLYLLFEFDSEKQNLIYTFKDSVKVIPKYDKNIGKSYAFIIPVDKEFLSIDEKIIGKDVSITSEELGEIFVEGNIGPIIDETEYSKFLVAETEFIKKAKPEKIYSYEFDGKEFEISALSEINPKRENLEFLKVESFDSGPEHISLRNYKTIYSENDESIFYVDLGSNFYEPVTKTIYEYKSGPNTNLRTYITDNPQELKEQNNYKLVLIEKVEPLDNFFRVMQKCVEYLRLLYLTIFYVSGILIFVVYYFKKNFMEKDNDYSVNEF
ncbi:MAG: hypothetical protein ACOCXG_04295 [Nanoarchaeota archaeon]